MSFIVENEPVLNKRICIICEDPKGFTPKHWHTVCCYDPKCRTIYKERQRIRAAQKMKEWREKYPQTRCHRRGCDHKIAKGKYYCPSCVVKLSGVYLDPSLTEGGQLPSEMQLWPSTPSMEYD